MMVLQLAISLLAGMGFAKLIEMIEAWSKNRKTMKKLDLIQSKLNEIQEVITENK